MSGAYPVLTWRRLVKGAELRVRRLALLAAESLGNPRDYFCPCCETAVAGFYRGPGGPYGCPRCCSAPRERLAVHSIKTERLPLASGVAVLHLAPNERSLRFHLKSAAGDYVAGDFHPEVYKGTGCIKVDLTNIGETERFDVVYASHVMEHVVEDRQAMRSIFQSLKPGGAAWLIVPLRDAPTDESQEDLSPLERERRFGQWDHVRIYGPDFADRLREAGFTVSVISPDQFSSSESERMGFDGDDKIFVAVRPWATG